MRFNVIFHITIWKLRFRIGQLLVFLGQFQLHIVLFCRLFMIVLHFFESKLLLVFYWYWYCICLLVFLRSPFICFPAFPLPFSPCLPSPGRRCGGLLRRLHRLCSLREQSERWHRAATGGVWGRSGVGGASDGDGDGDAVVGKGWERNWYWD